MPAKWTESGWYPEQWTKRKRNPGIAVSRNPEGVSSTRRRNTKNMLIRLSNLYSEGTHIPLFGKYRHRYRILAYNRLK